MKLNKPYTNKEYADFAVYCNQNDCNIVDQTDYLEAVKNEQAILSYKEKRMMEYPCIAEQLDMIYWDKVNNTNVWLDTIAQVKAKYPKK